MLGSLVQTTLCVRCWSLEHSGPGTCSFARRAQGNASGGRRAAPETGQRHVRKHARGTPETGWGVPRGRANRRRLPVMPLGIDAFDVSMCRLWPRPTPPSLWSRALCRQCNAPVPRGVASPRGLGLVSSHPVRISPAPARIASACRPSGWPARVVAREFSDRRPCYSPPATWSQPPPSPTPLL